MQKITAKRIVLFSIALVASVMFLVSLCFAVLKFEAIETGECVKNTGFDLIGLEFSKSFSTLFTTLKISETFTNAFGIVFGSMSILTLVLSVGAIVTVVVGFFKLADDKAKKVLISLIVSSVVVLLAYMVLSIVFSSLLQADLIALSKKEDFKGIDELAKFSTAFYGSFIIETVLLIAYIICQALIKGAKNEAVSIKENKREYFDAKNLACVKNSVKSFIDLLKKYKTLSDDGVINVTEQIEKSVKAINYFAVSCNKVFIETSKKGVLEEVIEAENLALDVVKTLKELLDQGFLSAETYVRIRALILSSVF